MKKILLYISIVMVVIMAAGCNSNGENKTQENSKANNSDGEMADELLNGSDEVMAVLDDLQANLENKDENSELIQKTGKDLEENWDEMEKKVEENFPEDYERIEESLYPLISESQKDQGDSAKMKVLVTQTKEKLESFNEKLAKE
ncbi:hypothetical protein DFO70_102320 [Cytobacillus firmus]|uniref:DUF7605 domain-containing protein n=2 Tax=Cytobacillus TaxID=2675230 RepID=A0A366K4G4_CYTFI|nr:MULTISPECIES: hypothetical protein [Cytobacillus]RBP95993.1 hypothetical protein DFO70_102320 [Cytobacillus firmus]TDX44906.1 hypothetical protein DFO72_103320 [Cytobacillus oceanisediminis]